jgi:hypothetical protein
MLEQAHDTKDLNRVQRPLAVSGKLVGNSVDGFVTGGSLGVESGKGVLKAVHETRSPSLCHQVIDSFSPHVPSIDCCSGWVGYLIDFGLVVSV